MLPKRFFKRTLSNGFIEDLRSPVDVQITDAAVPGLHMRYSARTHRKVFYLSYRIKGTMKQRNMRLGTSDEMSLVDVRERALKLKREVSSGFDPWIIQRERAREAAEKEARRTKLKDVTPVFLDRHCKVNNRPATYKAHESLVRLFINPIMGDRIIEEVDLRFIQDTYDKIRYAKSIACADHVLRLLSTFLNWCEKYNHRPINSNPCHLITKAKAPKFKPTLLDLEGYQKLVAALDEALEIGRYSPQAILALKALMLTGCRSGEISDLERDELDLEHGYLRLKKRKTDFLDVPLGAPAIEVIRQALAICKSKKYVFHSSIDRDKPVVQLRPVFWWALERAGLPRMRIHDLRHSFATMATSIGEDIRTLKDVLGHTKITTTEIYAHTSNAAARRTANNVATAIMTPRKEEGGANEATDNL
jgi:integrase